MTGASTGCCARARPASCPTRSSGRPSCRSCPFAFFFGPLPGWAIAAPAVGWPLHLVLVLVGALMVLPLVGLDDDVSSLAVGLSLAIGSFELVIDALPGIVLRLHTHLATS